MFKVITETFSSASELTSKISATYHSIGEEAILQLGFLLRILNYAALCIREEATLILLTKLDNSAVAISIEAIKYIESMPDTLILFLNGDSIIVKEKVDAIVHKITEFKTSILREANI